MRLVGMRPSWRASAAGAAAGLPMPRAPHCPPACLPAVEPIIGIRTSSTKPYDPEDVFYVNTDVEQRVRLAAAGGAAWRRGRAAPSAAAALALQHRRRCSMPAL